MSAADPVAEFLAAHRAGDLVALATSGTSGTARVVVRSTDSWVSSFVAVSELTGLTSGSRVWVPGPLTATMNLFAAVHAATVGAVLVADLARATHAQLTPSRLAATVGTGALDGTRVVVAGDRLSPALHARARAEGAVMHHYYGAAELSFVTWGTHAGDLRAFPGVDVVVRDGEVWVRSPYLCVGYDGRPGPLRRDSEGLATVGDRGELRDGRLVVHGRADAVTTAGATVLVADVESVLRSAATGEVLVVGLPHDDLGAVLAVVLTERDDLDAVRARARTLSGAERPRLWLHLADPPLTASGKVDRTALVSRLSGADNRTDRLL
jgi:acyl-CoA synthetase (AMP-forming)/AMP-acid ligase II